MATRYEAEHMPGGILAWCTAAQKPYK